MKYLIITLLLMVQNGLLAGVQRKSFYFNSNSISVVESSQSELNKFRDYVVNSSHVQLIEVNAFVENVTNNYSINDLLNQRVNYLSEFLVVDLDDASVNFFGLKREKLNFTVDSWERVDIYYYEEAGFLLSSYDGNYGKKLDSDEIKSIEQSDSKRESSKQKSRMKSVFSTSAINLELKPIQFEPGSYKIKPNSEKYLEDVYNALYQNPTLKAHIRGHVCCANRIIPSWRRAKKVFRYLVDKGIDKKRLTYKGYGNKCPIILNESTAYARSSNRRVDVVFNQAKYKLIELSSHTSY